MSNSFLIRWIISQISIFTLAIPLSMLVGSIIAELFFIFIFVFFPLVGLSQYFVLKPEFDWAKEWLKWSAIGFFLGSILALVQIFMLVDNIDLISNHIISLFIISITTAFFQNRVMNKNTEENLDYFWLLTNLLIVVLFLMVATIVNMSYDLKFQLLIVPIEDYWDLLPWTWTGLIFGVIYSLACAWFFNGYIMVEQ